jgi:hypothetical protein
MVIRATYIVGKIRGQNIISILDWPFTDLGKFALGALSLVLGPEGGNVHLLGLLLHVLFVSSYGSYNEVVGVDDAEQGGEVAEEGVNEDVASAEPVLVQIVSAAGGHVALRHIPRQVRC